MRLSLALGAALVAAAALASNAHAATLITPPAFVASDNHIACQIANAGTKAVRDLTIEVLRYNPGTSATVEVTGPVGDLAALAWASDGLTNGTVSAVFVCRFTFKGSAKGLRAAALIRDPGAEIVDSYEAR